MENGLYGWKRQRLFLVFTMKLFSSALSSLTAQSTWTSVLLEHLHVFKHKHKSNIKEAIFELRSSHLFQDQPYKEVLEVKCQACNFIGVLSFRDVFEDFGHIFLTCFCHNLICNKFAMLKNKKLTEILEVGKFISYLPTVPLTVRNHQLMFLIG